MYNSDYFIDNNIEVSKAEMLKELFDHGIEDAQEFFEIYGIKDTYNSKDILFWLGY
mgnify:CR=1 FL=1